VPLTQHKQQTSQQTKAGNRERVEKFYSRSHDAVIRVDDAAGNVIKTHEHKGDFKEW